MGWVGCGLALLVGWLVLMKWTPFMRTRMGMQMNKEEICTQESEAEME